MTVDNQLPAGGTLYDRPHNSILWAALAEKALAQENESGWLGTVSPRINSYLALDGGNCSTAEAALSAFTGLNASSFSINANDVASAMQQGKLVVVGTGDTVANSHIAHNHEYAVVGYDPSSSMPFTVFNPWGVYGDGNSIWGTFTANGPALEENFVAATLAGSTAPGANLAGSPMMACAFDTAPPAPSSPHPSALMLTPRATPAPVIVAPETALPMPLVPTQVSGKARAALHHDLALDALQQHEIDLSWVA